MSNTIRRVGFGLFLGLVVLVGLFLYVVVSAQSPVDPVVDMSSRELLEEILATNIMIYGELIAERQVNMGLILPDQQGYQAFAAIAGMCAFYWPEGGASCSFTVTGEGL